MLSLVYDSELFAKEKMGTPIADDRKLALLDSVTPPPLVNNINGTLCSFNSSNAGLAVGNVFDPRSNTPSMSKNKCNI